MAWARIWDRVVIQRLETLEHFPKGVEDLLYLQDLKITYPEHKSTFQSLLSSKPARVLEIGCGVGATISLFAEIGSECYGCDVSAESIKIASQYLKSKNFKTSSAPHIPFDASIKFDLVLSNSVFQYLSSADCATATLNAMLMRLSPKKGSAIYISDLFNQEKQVEYKKFRMRELGIDEPAWKERYANSKHLYFHQDFFRDWARKNGLNIQLSDPSGYLSDHKDFRFDVLITSN